MPKVINYIFTNIKTLITICFILALVVFGSYKYNQTYVIKYTYDGIKYQSNNLNSGIPMSIEVDGVYKKGYFGNPDIFEGSIVLGGELCYGQYRHRSHEYAFNNYKMSQIESDNFKGSFFINDMFKEITITLHEIESTGNESFSYNDGWLISAPSENREQAVNISNKLIQKLHKDVNIK
jgi:hypothetical protein